MADTKAPEREKGKNYLKEVMGFYLAPDLRSIGTLIYLGIFGFFVLYYVDNLFLAIRFLLYIVLGHTALSGIGYLFAGAAFIVSLVLPFFVSFYAIFVLHRIWSRPTWALYIKWAMTVVVILGSLCVIVQSDDASRLAARQPSIQSFVEDANLTGRI